MNIKALNSGGLRTAVLACCAFIAGACLMRGDSGARGPQTYDGAIPCHPGPWGALSYTPISIAAPDELLPIRTIEKRPLHWFFGGYALTDFIKLCEELGLPDLQRKQLLQPDCANVLPTGLILQPSRETVYALNPALRREIFRRLVRFPENRDDYTYIPTVEVEGLWRQYNLSTTTVALLKDWSCNYGRYTVIYGASCILPLISAEEEKVRFMKALSWQQTYLLRVHITPDTDIHSLTKYWGRACWSTDVEAFLHSLATVREGSWLDVIELLPPFPTSLLYTYPVPQNPLKGPVVRRDCHWTAMNFFRDPSDDRYADAKFVRQHIMNDYFPVATDPRYGDLVLFMTPTGEAIHSSIFLADDFVYSKNGDSPLHPWLISTVSNLLEHYSFIVPPEQKLTVQYFRNKYY